MLSTAHRWHVPISSPLGIVAALAVSALLAACEAVLVSKPYPKTFQNGNTLTANDLNEQRQGVAYFLPKRMVALKIDRAPQPTDLQQQLAQAKDALASAASALEKAAANRAEAAALAEEVAKTDNAQAIADTAARAIEAVAKETIEQSNVGNATAEVDRLQTEIANTPNNGACPEVFDIQLSLLPPEPDPEQVYLANIDHSPFRDDELKIKTTPEGLLTTADVTATDRTADIIVDLAGAIAGLAFPPSLPGLARTERAKEIRCPLAVTFERRFDPAVDDVAIMNKDLDSAQMPFALYWKLLGDFPSIDKGFGETTSPQGSGWLTPPVGWRRVNEGRT